MTFRKYLESNGFEHFSINTLHVINHAQKYSDQQKSELKSLCESLKDALDKLTKDLDSMSSPPESFYRANELLNNLGIK